MLRKGQVYTTGLSGLAATHDGHERQNSSTSILVSESFRDSFRQWKETQTRNAEWFHSYFPEDYTPDTECFAGRSFWDSTLRVAPLRSSVWLPLTPLGIGETTRKNSS